VTSSYLHKRKLKLKERRFDSTEEIQAELHREKRTSRNLSENRREGGTGVYMRERTTSRMMVADRSYGNFYNFYNVSPE
jgi:hypothetical protein